MAFVLDASATLPWCFRDETTPHTDALLMRAETNEEMYTPSHWPTETLNALLQAHRRQRVTAAEIDTFLSKLGGFHIEVESRPLADHLAAVRQLAEAHGLTAYDAAYLELAKRLALPLASFDRRLCDAALAENVAVIG